MAASRIGVLTLAGILLVVLGNMWFHRGLQQRYVTLTWQVPSTLPGVTVVGYNVYRSTSSGKRYSLIAGRLRHPEFEDHQVNSGKNYYYVVTALDQFGRESKVSEEIAGQVP